MLWRVQVPRADGIDYMTTTDPNERNQYQTSDGLIFYVPANNAVGRGALNRLYNSSIPDHMEDEGAGGGGYTYQSTVGYPWTSSAALPGLSQIARVYSPTSFDHTTIRPGEVLSGYSTWEGFSKWGYARNNNRDDADMLLSITAGGVTIDSNLNAGGCVWQWTYRGHTFIDHYDYGREMQASFFAPDSNDILRNPTECGDGNSTRTMAPQDRQGSPLITGYNDGSTQITSAVPLDWFPENFGGGPGHPVLDEDFQLGKTLALNYGGFGPVVQYTTNVYTPYTIDLAQQNALYIPGIALPLTYNQYYTFDAVTKVSTQVQIACGDSIQYLPSAAYGGVIISDSGGANALGLFAKVGSASGPDKLKMGNRTCNPPAAQISWMNGAYKRVIPQGSSSYNTWIMSGTVAEVESLQHQIYCKLNVFCGN